MFGAMTARWSGRPTGISVRVKDLPPGPTEDGLRRRQVIEVILRVLERKGHIRHVEEGMRYVYLPVVTREKAKKSAIDRLVATFFDGSVKAAAAAFVDPATSKLSKEDLEDLERLIRKARKEKE